jgi:hypothetical protein
LAYLCVVLNRLWEITRYDGCFIDNETGELHRACGGPVRIRRKNKRLHLGCPGRVFPIGQPAIPSRVSEMGRETGL